MTRTPTNGFGGRIEKVGKYHEPARVSRIFHEPSAAADRDEIHAICGLDRLDMEPAATAFGAAGIIHHPRDIGYPIDAR